GVRSSSARVRASAALSSVAAGRLIPNWGFGRGERAPCGLTGIWTPVDRSYSLISSQALSTREAEFSVLPRRNRRPATPVRFAATATSTRAGYRSPDTDDGP